MLLSINIHHTSALTRWVHSRTGISYLFHKASKRLSNFRWNRYQDLVYQIPLTSGSYPLQLDPYINISTSSRSVTSYPHRDWKNFILSGELSKNNRTKSMIMHTRFKEITTAWQDFQGIMNSSCFFDEEYVTQQVSKGTPPVLNPTANIPVPTAALVSGKGIIDGRYI